MRKQRREKKKRGKDRADSGTDGRAVIGGKGLQKERGRERVCEKGAKEGKRRKKRTRRLWEEGLQKGTERRRR